MAMQRKLSSLKPPDGGLLEISDRVYVFDCCLTLEYSWSEKKRYKGNMDGIVGQFRENVPDASIMVCNFREEETKTKIGDILCKNNVTVMDYPGHYHGCPVPEMEDIRHFLRSCENWLSRGEHNVLLMHCENGDAWPALGFMLAALLIFRKQCNGEERTLDMVYGQAPHKLLHMMMPLDPIPSQLRYLEYVSRWNVALDWPPLDRALRLDCIILRYIPNLDGKGNCRPMFRIYGQDPALADKNSKILYSMPKRAKNVRAYKQGEYELIIVDINCHVQGDVLIESINLNGDLESEQMMFHAMFNTAFLRSNILMLNRDKIDVLWDAKDHFPKDFRAEILFSEMDAAAAVLENGTSCFDEKEGLPIEAFSKAQEIFSNGDWMSPREDPALNALQQRRASAIIHDKLDTSSGQYVDSGTFLHQTGPQMPQEKKNEANCFLPSNLEIQSVSSTKQIPDNDMSRKEDKTIKVDTTPPQPSSSDIICQEMPSTVERTSESSNWVTDSKNLYTKQHSSDLSLPGSVDTTSSGSISPKTPPLRPPVTSSTKEVHDSPPHMESHRHHVLPLKSRHPVTEETESQSQDRSRSFSFNSTTGTPFSSTLQNKSQADGASHPSASAITSTQPPPPLSSATPPLKKILPVKTRSDSSLSKPQTMVSPPTPPLKEHEPIRARPPPSPPIPPPMDETHDRSKNHTKKLKPLNWLKLSRAVKGSLWAETQKSGEASKAPEIDRSELESLFSAAVPSKGPAKKSKVQSSVGPKSDKVQLIDYTRAYNIEILLSKVKVPLQDLMSSVLALEESALDTDLVENLIKFCPTKEEIELLKGYTGEKEKLGRCEQFFLELMKVPRVESKLRVFSFKIQFHSQVSDLRNNLHVVNAASEEIRNSVKFKRIMQTILSLGNTLNQGTAKGFAIGFRLDSLLKLTETRSQNKKITLMHYLCKVLADKLREVLDFSKDLANLEPAAKIQLKFVAEEMQAIRKGLEKVKHELSSSENDGPISETFCKNLKEFLCSAEAEVSSLASLYSVVGGNVDALIIYFGEDPSRCPFEQVVTTLLNFTGMFNKAHEENCNQLELEMKKTEECEKKK